MLKINGVAVYPEDIENKINKLTYINECVISGVSNFDENNWLCLIYKKNKISRNIEFKIRKYCMIIYHHFICHVISWKLIIYLK